MTISSIANVSLKKSKTENYKRERRTSNLSVLFAKRTILSLMTKRAKLPRKAEGVEEEIVKRLTQIQMMRKLVMKRKMIYQIIL